MAFVISSIGRGLWLAELGTIILSPLSRARARFHLVCCLPEDMLRIFSVHGETQEAPITPGPCENSVSPSLPEESTMNSQLAARRIVFFLGMVAAVVPGAQTTVATGAEKMRSAEHSHCHCRRLVVWPRGGLWLQLDQNTGLRSGGAGRECCFQRLHEQPQMRPCRASIVDRAEYLAA